MEIKEIAYIHTPFPDKFGIPRQSGMADLPCEIVFTPEYRIDEALRKIEDFSYLWLLWGFSLSDKKKWSPTVRPPRLGGNRHVGVFATRSPYRPNPIGISSVKLLGVEKTKKYGKILHISGADMADGTPIYDIKPYLAYTDSHPDAAGGFADDALHHILDVEYDPGVESQIPPELEPGVRSLLACDPRPSYHDDPDRIYGVHIYGFDIRFTVEKNKLTVKEIIKNG